MEWERDEDSNSSSTTATCTVLCSVPSSKDSGDSSDPTPSNEATSSKSRVSKKSDKTSKKLDWKKSEMTCDLKYSGISMSIDGVDETDRLIELRATDYSDVVEDSLKVVIAMAGYPKSKMRLQQLGQFQECLTDIMELQLKSGILKQLPVFLDYYLNRGALVCVCKDDDTRDWVLRISSGLQERMRNNLIFLKSKVKRLCLALLKIPKGSWPATALDVFKLLQYFNSNLKTDSWEIYAQKVLNNVEYTSFLIDRVSGEIIRGPRFRNVIDYSQIQFELTGYTEIYYECLLSEFEEICSIASRAKLLSEIRSKDFASDQNSNDKLSDIPSEFDVTPAAKRKDVLVATSEISFTLETKNSADQDEVSESHLESDDDDDDDSKKSNRNGVWVRSKESKQDDNAISDINKTADRISASENTESLLGSRYTIDANSIMLSDGKKGLAFNRRTNYLHVENELKVAVILDGYPNEKLEGSHVRRLKSLFKEHLNKDMKTQRFPNFIIPKFVDIYLSNGALIYICDSLETKEYLIELLPKFTNSTRLKLTVKDVKDLVRFTRVIMRLPKEHVQVESIEILTKLQLKYPDLKPDCWKYYSDFPGKQKRQFGVDPDSLDVIKSADFNPEYEGEKLSFRIIDRKKCDCKDDDNIELKEKFLKIMYEPLELDITRTQCENRGNHYSEFVPDDQKIYVGPSNYPEIRVDDNMFTSIKTCLNSIAYDQFKTNNEENVVKIRDMYLFDGVIFIICKNIKSKAWIEDQMPVLNCKLQLNLKVTEYRGAVGIVNMQVKTFKDANDVITALQEQNPRLRTKFWRVITSDRVDRELYSVLQIDKLSAQIIKDIQFNGKFGECYVSFKLGHLCSLIKAESNIKVLNSKEINPDATTITIRIKMRKTINIKKVKSELEKRPELNITIWRVISEAKTLNDKFYDVETDTQTADILLSPNFVLKLGKKKIFFLKYDESAVLTNTELIKTDDEKVVKVHEQMSAAKLS